MDLTGIFTIGGKPGLQKLVAQSANGVIVESLTDGKRFNAYSSYKISSLEDISIYGTSEDIPLKEVFLAIAKSNDFKKVDLPAKGAFLTELSNYIDVDQERVYESDVKKLFGWYNLLIDANLVVEESEEGAVEEKETEEKEAKA